MSAGGERREEVKLKFQEGSVEKVPERRGDGSREQREQGSSEGLARGTDQCAGGRRRGTGTWTSHRRCTLSSHHLRTLEKYL